MHKYVNALSDEAVLITWQMGKVISTFSSRLLFTMHKVAEWHLQVFRFWYFYVWISNQFSTEKYVVFWLEIKHPFFSSIRFITMISCFKRECPSGILPLSVTNRDGFGLCINHFYITHKTDLFCYAYFMNDIWYQIKFRSSFYRSQLYPFRSCSLNRFQFIILSSRVG